MAKSVLFVGCSLTNDRTMKVLKQCLKQNGQIRHFAIVELPEDEDEEIKQRESLTELGIEPIYFPKDDYKAIDLIIAYLAEDNPLIKAAEKILHNYLLEEEESAIYEDMLLILNKCYYDTGAKFLVLFEMMQDDINILSEYAI